MSRPRSETHGTTTAYASGCRCDACKRAKSAARAEAVKRAAKYGRDDHGTTAAYYAGCRCQMCVEANSRRRRQRQEEMLKRLSGNPDDAAHGTPAGYRSGCECRVCTAARRSAVESAHESMRASGNVRHGTRTGYQVHGCRCQECREAARQYRIAYAATASVKHGTPTGYSTFGCRCAACLEAGRGIVRRRMARARQA